MSYVDLHQHCCGLNPYIKRKAIYEKVLKIKGVSRVAHVIMELDTTSCRGLYLSSKNTNHPFVRQNGGHVVVTARGLSSVWQRFVFLKELMHVFDDPDEATDSGDAFERLLAEFTQPTPTQGWSPQMEAEIDSFWMATNLICPQKARDSLRSRASDPDELPKIAKEVGIPESHVQYLFAANYEQIIAEIIEK
jgi:Zn-dependent peptidase ImmA (M78 family)